jgi:hypothetical protein
MPEPNQDTGPGKREQARNLAEKALQAERVGDMATADRLFAEADRIDPEAVMDLLQEHEPDRPRRRPTDRR